MKYALALLCSLVLAGCGDGDGASQEEAPTVVLAAAIQSVDADSYTLPGSVHAERETPLSFRIAGQLQERHVEAGDTVEAGQLLMSLDPRDADQRLAGARAELASAKAQAANAEAERKRLKKVLEQKYVSQNTYDTAATNARAAQESVRGAQAAVEQAANALSYTDLVAPSAGVLMEVSGEVGQTVGPGEPVALLAHEGRREIEVFVSERRRRALPRQGLARLFGSNESATALLSEIAGAADPVTRTWRARYRLEGEGDDWPLGASATLHLATSSDTATSGSRVPLAAVVDRGDGPAVWVIRDGQAQPEPVRLLRVDDQFAYIETALPEGTPVVAIGGHLLTPGQKVRPRS